MAKFKWSRSKGYECSTHGDIRFSAFGATLNDGRTIEQWFQCDIKGYDKGGVDWKKGKNKPSLIEYNNIYLEYLRLWEFWAIANESTLDELRELAIANDFYLSDKFAKTECNQARALVDILNKGVRMESIGIKYSGKLFKFLSIEHANRYKEFKNSFKEELDEKTQCILFVITSYFFKEYLLEASTDALKQTYSNAIEEFKEENTLISLSISQEDWLNVFNMAYNNILEEVSISKKIDTHIT